MRVELQNITKLFGELRANDDVTLTFEPGRIYGLLGENGAGKRRRPPGRNPAASL